MIEQLTGILHLIYDQTLLQQLWNKVFLADVIKTNNIRFDESISIGEDFRFILDYIKYANLDKVVFIKRTLYHYMRDQEGSLMFHVGYESVDEQVINLEKLYKLEGLQPDSIKSKLKKDKEHLIQQNAYLIMHNAGMKMNEKKRLILALDSEQGNSLFKQNKYLYFKEKIANLIK